MKFRPAEKALLALTAHHCSFPYFSVKLVKETPFITGHVVTTEMLYGILLAQQIFSLFCTACIYFLCFSKKS